MVRLHWRRLPASPLRHQDDLAPRLFVLVTIPLCTFTSPYQKSTRTSGMGFFNSAFSVASTDKNDDVAGRKVSVANTVTFDDASRRPGER